MDSAVLALFPFGMGKKGEKTIVCQVVDFG